MASIKAPAGGLVSPVNNQFYAGGEFMPDHGKSIAAKPVVKTAVSYKTGLPVYGTGKHIYDVMNHASLVFHVKADNATQAETEAKARGAEYWYDVARQF